MRKKRSTEDLLAEARKRILETQERLDELRRIKIGRENYFASHAQRTYNSAEPLSLRAE